MKKVLCFVLLSVFVFVNFSAFVVGAVVDFDTISDYYFEDYASLPQDFKDLCNAYINYFKSVGSFTVSFSDMTQIPKSWFKVLGDGVFALSPVDDVIYYLSDGQLMVSNRHGGGGGHHRAEETLPVVSSSDFKSIVDDRKNIYKYFPTGDIAVASLKNDVLYSSSDYDKKRNYSYFTFLADKNFFGFADLHECYVVPFVWSEVEGYYFSPYSYKLSLDMTSNDGHGNSAITDIVISKTENLGSVPSDDDFNDYWKLSSHSLPSSSSVFDFLQSYPYACLYGYGWTHMPFYTYSNYLGHDVYKYDPNDLEFFGMNFKSSSGLTTSHPGGIFSFASGYTGPAADLTKDFGFFVSKSPFGMGGFAADIDTQRIPDNYYITVGGDTIYDYTITNPSTGQGDTINNYVTNNYTFIDSGDGGGSGGSVGGNVTVGGQIDVSGSVDVDVNVNINGGAGGTGSLPDVDVDTNPLDEYLTSAIDDSSGVRKFIGIFFDFCPPEILVLLGIGLTFVIMGRILGR